MFRGGHWELSDLLEIAPFVDAIETFNSRCMDMTPNLKALEFARVQHLSGTAGSDAHTTLELGSACLELDEFSNADDLRRVIVSARQNVRLSSPFIHLSSRYATIVKQLGLVKI